MKIDHILVATDLSPEATTCIPSVASLAREVGARITLLHVLEALEAIPHGSPLAPPLRVSDDPEAAQRAREQLEERRAAFGPGIDIKIELIAGGDAAHEIVEYASAHDVDLIAVTTHGRTGFKRLALGSVAEMVIRHSRVPVLVLPLPRD
jgi:nucleotide-binding universal stress UspA family protein